MKLLNIIIYTGFSFTLLTSCANSYSGKKEFVSCGNPYSHGVASSLGFMTVGAFKWIWKHYFSEKFKDYFFKLPEDFQMVSMVPNGGTGATSSGGTGDVNTPLMSSGGDQGVMTIPSV